jgi:tagatose 1,6-diphosphate aldolase GatY/KbaY
MIAATLDLVRAAASGGYALGAFNVYNLEGIQAVIAAAEAESSPALLQVHPAPLQFGGKPLLALCYAAAEMARVPIGLHLDHSTSARDIEWALEAGFTSVMADGSPLPYAENVAFTRAMATLAHAHGAAVEAELGRLSGTEDGLTVAEYEARLTDPAQAAEFVRETQADLLAVCVGNVHGRYRSSPQLDLGRLAALRDAVSVPLVLHGASGLPVALVQRCIMLGVRKFNVNTELREAYIAVLKTCLAAPAPPDLLDVLHSAVEAMQMVVVRKLRLFGSAGRASDNVSKRGVT